MGEDSSMCMCHWPIGFGLWLHTLSEFAKRLAVGSAVWYDSEHSLDLVFELERTGSWFVIADDFTLGINKELTKVPLDLSGGSLLGIMQLTVSPQVLIHFTCVRTIDITLLKHGELDASCLGELCHLSIGAWLLPHELV